MHVLLLFLCSTCLIYHLYVVLTLRVVLMPHCLSFFLSPLKQLLYNLSLVSCLNFGERLVYRRRSVSLFGPPPFLAPLHFSHLSFHVPSLQLENFLFTIIYLYLLFLLPNSYHFSFIHYIIPTLSSQILFLHQLHPPSMGRDHHFICGQRLGFISISIFFLIISSWTHLEFVTAGRKTLKQNGFYQRVHEDKAMVRARIGSRPPRCERRCRTCGHCEAIQVPTNPQAQSGKFNPSTLSAIAYAGGEGSSNYKPMSWKCKCGNLIFNP